MNTSAELREHLVSLLNWENAHCSFDRAVADFPVRLRGKVPNGLPYSGWQLVEHLRICQRDILDFCRNANYVEKSWPDDYWPAAKSPPSAAAWNGSVAAFRADLRAFVKLVRGTSVDLFATVPSDPHKTFLREVLLLADHNAYHVGQLVYVRRLLGAWPGE